MLMVSMGITLTPKDFQDVIKNPASTGNSLLYVLHVHTFFAV
jgi:hypothetical protein